MASDGRQPLRNSGRIAAKGMAWTAIALALSKVLSFGSQIVLGHLLPVETYAVFALVGTATIFVTVFQNSGVGKALVQGHDRLDQILPDYSAFALWMGLIGVAVFLVVGAIFQHIYAVPDLFWVIALTSVSVPLIAVAVVCSSLLSIRFAYRDINVAEMKRAFAYYALLILVAILGADAFTMAIALTVTSALHLWLLAARLKGTRYGVRIRPRRFFAILVQLRWVILSAFLFATAMNGDYLVLGLMLSQEDLGHYYFGFMLVTSATIMLSAGVNQALLPVFSQLREDPAVIQAQFLKISGAILLLCDLLCIGLVGLGPALIHVIWGGKWDPAIVVVISIAAVLPVRLMSNLGAVIFEAKGRWGQRALALSWDAAVIIAFSWAGAHFGGLAGAALAVALQRAMSGLLAFGFSSTLIGLRPLRILVFILRNMGPYAVAVAALIVLAPDRHHQIDSAGDMLRPALETIAAIAAFLAVNGLFNRDLLAVMVNLVRRRKAG
ncbi:oligosaccharide flippase family protein [Zavarzinia sp. CC-PAN008]|uniref:oligosaccharide flippase family protein n=1 Tax=Zavarzinia sp. CC-PAN008 TaxID=3243332 RepID=UPI003F745F1D